MRVFSKYALKFGVINSGGNDFLTEDGKTRFSGMREPNHRLYGFLRVREPS